MIIRNRLLCFIFSGVLAACSIFQATPVVPVSTDASISPTKSSTIEVSPTNTTSPKCAAPYFEPVAFFPDGKRLLVKNEQKIFIVDSDTWKQDGTFEIPIVPGSVVALSPDGHILAFTQQQENIIRLVSMEEGNIIHTLSGHTNIITDLKFTPGSDRLLSASHDTWVRIWDRGGNLESSFQPTGADNFPSEVLGMAISPDGTMLATIPFNGPVKLWDMTTHAEISEMGGSGGYDTSDIAFSSDGQYLASDLATGLWIWRLSDGSLVSSGINTMAFAFSPDGRLIAYSDIARNYDVILVSLEDMQELHTLAGNNGWLTFFVDDTRLMSTNVVETRVWQVEEERLLFVVCNSDQ